MKLTIALLFISFIGFGQIDTLKTPIKLTTKQLQSFSTLEIEKKKFDSIYNIRYYNVLDFVLDANGLDILDLIAIEPKGEGKLIIKTKKK